MMKRLTTYCFLVAFSSGVLSNVAVAVSTEKEEQQQTTAATTSMMIQKVTLLESPTSPSSRKLSELENRYAISEPIFNYDNLQFDLEYTTSDEMSDEQISYEVYDGHECRDGDGIGNSTGNDLITNSTYLPSRLRPDLTSIGEGSDGTRSFKVTLNVNSEEIQNSPIFKDFETYAHVYFCVRFTNWNIDYLEENAIEVNYVETPVLLVINLVDGFEINLDDVADTDFVVQMAYDDTAVEGYICDNLQNVVEGDAKNQGESIRVCVTPTSETLEQGAYLRYIDEFTFQRDEYTQVAIESNTNGQAATELTVVSCISGSLICAFETLLGSQFFTDGVGVVYGYGTAFLQFGQDPIIDNNNQRRQERERKLQDNNAELTPEEALAARPTAFSFEIVMIPRDNEFAQSGAPMNTNSRGSLLLLLLSSFVVVFGVMAF